MNPADTKAWLSAYHTQGYVVLKNVIDIETVEATKAACNVLVDALADRLVCFNKDGIYMMHASVCASARVRVRVRVVSHPPSRCIVGFMPPAEKLARRFIYSPESDHLSICNSSIFSCRLLAVMLLSDLTQSHLKQGDHPPTPTCGTFDSASVHYL